MRDLSPHDLQYLLFSVKWTLLLAAISFSGGAVGGMLIAFARLSRSVPLRLLGGAYVAVLQGTPLLMQLFLCFFGLSLLGYQIPPLAAASIALVANSSAFLGEIWRGCIAAIPQAQWEGSISLGMTRLQQFVYVIAPQAFRIALPPTANYTVQIVKNTALASIIGFADLVRTARMLDNITFAPLILFGTTALIYLVLCGSLTSASMYWERRHSGDGS